MANISLGASFDLAKSDTENAKFNWVMVTTTAGTVIVGQVGGNETTLTAVPVGVWVPVGEGLYVTTGSTAVGLLAV